MELNDNLRVQDVKAENMEVLNSPRIPIASVTLTRQLKQEEATVKTPVAADATATAVPAGKAAPAAKGAPAAPAAAAKK